MAPTRKRPSVRATAALLALVASTFAASASAWGPHTGPKPGCGYGDSHAHSGPPGIMAKGGFDKDQPANPGGAKECPQPAGGEGGNATPHD